MIFDRIFKRQTAEEDEPKKHGTDFPQNLYALIDPHGVSGKLYVSSSLVHIRSLVEFREVYDPDDETHVGQLIGSGIHIYRSRDIGRGIGELVIGDSSWVIEIPDYPMPHAPVGYTELVR